MALNYNITHISLPKERKKREAKMNSKKEKKMKRIPFIMIMMFILCSVVIYSQQALQDNDLAKINVMTGKLVQKLLLSDNQADAVNGILSDYFKGLQVSSGNGDKQKELRNTANGKLLNIFDNKQKMKFDIIKNEWWSLAN